MDVAQFLQLYSPLLLDKFERDDLLVPKLLIVSGSPGSGKSSLLRLFETESLISVYSRANTAPDDTLIERLTELGFIGPSGPSVMGLYLQCDSTLRDLANLGLESAQPLFNALLDVRLTTRFLRALRALEAAGLLQLPTDFLLDRMPSAENPPTLFAEAHTLESLSAACDRLEEAFGRLLNSFPGDEIPVAIQPHSRLYALSYLAHQTQHPATILSHLNPFVMLDDVQELYSDQRQQLTKEFLRRTSITRCFAVRSQVLELEQLISLEETQSGREHREIALDKIFRDHPSTFERFANGVVVKRLQHTDHLHDLSLADFRALFRAPDASTNSKDAANCFVRLAARLAAAGAPIPDSPPLQDTTSVGALLKLEAALILAERRFRRRQRVLFDDLRSSDAPDSGVMEAARLFLSDALGLPYYFGYDALVACASANVEQLLAASATIADRMIFRAELAKDRSLAAKEQEQLLRSHASQYYGGIEERHRRGAPLRQLVDNLGTFFRFVTYRPNAPIAPGVNGFGLTRVELTELVKRGEAGTLPSILSETLKSAVSGNVFEVRRTKQGQKDRQVVVFYLNRLLCVRFGLPLGYGGWQHIRLKMLVRMAEEVVPAEQVRSRSTDLDTLSWLEGPSS